MRGRKPTVPPKELFEALKGLHIFNEDGSLKTQMDDVWKIAYTRVERAITVKNIHINVSSNRHGFRDRLARELGSEHDQVDEEPIASLPLVVSSNSLVDINLLKADVTFNPMFKGIGGSPFYVFYWFPDQVDLYKKLIGKFAKIVALCKFDGIIKNASIYGVSSENLSLYAMLTQCGDKAVSFCHFFEEKSEESLLEFFIGVFLREDIPAPKSIIVEPQMVETVCSVFNELRLSQYYSLCLNNSLDGKESPHTIIKIDAFLVIKCVEELLRQHFQLPNIIEFFLKSFLFISTIDNIKDLYEVLEKIYIVLLSRYFHKEARISRQYLRTKMDQELIQGLREKYCEIESHSIGYFQRCIARLALLENPIFDILESKKREIEATLESYSKGDESSDDVTEENSDPKIQEEIRGKTEDWTINAYHNGEILDEMMIFLSLYPLWTKVPYVSDNAPLIYRDLQTSYRDSTLGFLEKNDDGTICEFPPEIFLEKHATQLLSSFSAWRELSEIAKYHYGAQARVVRRNNNRAHLNLVENWMDKGNKFELAKEEKQFDALNDNTNAEESESKENVWTLVDSFNDISEISAISLNLAQEIQFGELKEDITADRSESKKNKNKPTDNSHDTSKILADISLDHSYTKTPKRACDISVVNENEPAKKKLKHSTPEEKSVSNKKSSKYGNPCPSLEIIYNKPKKKGKFKDTLIKNGNKLRPKTYAKSKCAYKLGSTSLLDAYTEGVAHAIMQFSSFHKYCEDVVKNNGNEIIDIIFHYATTGNVVGYYQKRAAFMFKNGVIEKDVVIFKQSMTAFLNETMINIPSLLKVHTCCQCGNEEKIKQEDLHCFLEVAVHSTNPENMQTYIQQSINKLIKMDSFCGKCNHSNTLSTVIGPYLAIVPTDRNAEVDVRQLQSELIFNDNDHYFLAGVVGFTEPKTAISEEGFTAYLRSIQGHWRKKDSSLEKVTKKLRVSRTKTALILYVLSTC